MNKLHRKAVVKYYNRKFSNSKEIGKKTWKLINEVTGGNAEIGHSEVQLEGFLPDDTSGISNNFGKLFYNIGIKVRNSVKDRCKQVQEYIICDSGGESFELAFDRGTSDELLKLQLKG